MQKASVPGTTWRKWSARLAVSVRRGSITIRERSGSADKALIVRRASGMP